VRLREVTILLLDHGADVNATDKVGNTPLHAAVQTTASREAYLPVIETLISRGADINAQNHGGGTPLEITSWPEVVSIARRHGQYVTAPVGRLWESLEQYNEDVLKQLTIKISTMREVFRLADEEDKINQLGMIAVTVDRLERFVAEVEATTPVSEEFSVAHQRAIALARAAWNHARISYSAAIAKETYDTDALLSLVGSSVAVNRAIDQLNLEIERLARKCGLFDGQYYRVRIVD